MVRIPIKGPPTHPGEMLLEEFLKPLGMSQAEPAERIGVSYPRINELSRGKRGVTPDTALRWVVYRDKIWPAYLGASWGTGLYPDSKYRRLVLPPHLFGKSSLQPLQPPARLCRIFYWPIPGKINLPGSR